MCCVTVKYHLNKWNTETEVLFIYFTLLIFKFISVFSLNNEKKNCIFYFYIESMNLFKIMFASLSCCLVWVPPTWIPGVLEQVYKFNLNWHVAHDSLCRGLLNTHLIPSAFESQYIHKYINIFILIYISSPNTPELCYTLCIRNSEYSNVDEST
jgi:hypothetical protein